VNIIEIGAEEVEKERKEYISVAGIEKARRFEIRQTSVKTEELGWVTVERVFWGAEGH